MSCKYCKNDKRNQKGACINFVPLNVYQGSDIWLECENEEYDKEKRIKELKDELERLEK